jgi:hypothetical protein
VSRPRKPFGADHPGRLPATMMKVLAAEMSDPSRLRRGKQYAHDGSVLDIVIEPGVVTCEIQGTRPMPYIATVEVTRGDGMPLRRDVTVRCSCPDNENWEGYACKHVVAAMFALSNEFLLDPELLDRWRSRTGPVDDLDDSGEDAGEDAGAGGGADSKGFGRLRLVRDEPPPAPRSVGGERLAALLATPPGTALPDIPPIELVDPDLPPSRELAAVLRDALGNLRVRWE